MPNKLVIISNDKFYSHNNDYFCDHIAEKTLADELNNKFEVTLIGRKTNIQRSHRLKNTNIEHYNFIFSYLYAILKKILEKELKVFNSSNFALYFFSIFIIYIFKTKTNCIFKERWISGV